MMIKVSAIVSLLAVAVAGTAIPGVPRPATDGKGLSAADGPLAMCKDIPLSYSSEPQEHLCLMPAADVAQAASVAQNATVHLLAQGELTCTRDVEVPNSADASNLCNLFVPNTNIEVPWAPQKGTCSCRRYSRASAEFLVCNCDYCFSLIYPNPQSDCRLIQSSCVAHGVGGYRTWTEPLACYTVLELTQSITPTPVFESCYQP